jgi:hypothetical protein
MFWVTAAAIVFVLSRSMSESEYGIIRGEAEREGNNDQWQGKGKRREERRAQRAEETAGAA